MKIFRVSADFRFIPDPRIFSAVFFFLFFFFISTIDITGTLNTEQYVLTS